MKLKTIIVITCLAVSGIPIGIIAGFESFRATWPMISLIAIVTFTASITVAYFITRPIENLTTKIDTISKGKLDVKLEKSDINEINNLTSSLNRVMASLKLAVHKVGVKKGDIFETAVKEKEALEKKYHDFLKTVDGWAWETDQTGLIVFCSDNVAKYLDCSPDELTGQNFFNLLPPDQSNKTKKLFVKLGNKSKSIEDIKLCFTGKNGQNQWFITNSIPVYDDESNLAGFRGVSVNISEEKNAELKIKELKKELNNQKIEINNLLNRLEKIKLKGFDETGVRGLEDKWSEHEFDSVFISDENANVLDCNENMYKRLGYSKSEMLSLNIADFDALESKKDIVKKIDQAKKDGAVSFKTIYKRKDGSAVLVYENLQYLKDKKTFKCIVREDYSLNKSL